MTMETWVPIIVQIVAIFGGLLGYAIYSERRLTTMEVNIMHNAKTMQELAGTQRDQAHLLIQLNGQQQRLLALEERRGPIGGRQ